MEIHRRGPRSVKFQVADGCSAKSGIRRWIVWRISIRHYPVECSRGSFAPSGLLFRQKLLVNIHHEPWQICECPIYKYLSQSSWSEPGRLFARVADNHRLHGLWIGLSRDGYTVRCVQVNFMSPESAWRRLGTFLRGFLDLGIQTKFRYTTAGGFPA